MKYLKWVSAFIIMAVLIVYALNGRGLSAEQIMQGHWKHCGGEPVLGDTLGRDKVVNQQIYIGADPIATIQPQTEFKPYIFYGHRLTVKHNQSGLVGEYCGK